MTIDRTIADETGSSSVLSTLLICAVIVFVGSGALYFIYSTEPTAKRAAGAKTTAMLVETISADTGTYRPRIQAMGTVRPAREIILRPRVTGEVIDHSSEFTPGGTVQRGDTLVQLDPSDYRNTLQQRRSELRQAQSDLQVEMGRHDYAQEEYELLNESLDGENKELVLREPQLKSARAEVESAKAAFDQARLQLERTRIKAPFDAKVLNRNANIGSQVSAGDNLAHLVGTDTYWVETTVPLSKLRWLSFDKSDTLGSAVRIHNQSAWLEDEYRNGRLYKLVGELEENARMARILVSVEDPLMQNTNASHANPLILGSYVETSIRGRDITNVVRLKREYIRDEQTVWVMKDGKLDIRDVEVIFQDEDHAYIRKGLSENERIVTTNLSTVVDGAPLRQKSTKASESNESQMSSQAIPSSDADVIPAVGTSI